MRLNALFSSSLSSISTNLPVLPSLFSSGFSILSFHSTGETNQMDAQSHGFSLSCIQAKEMMRRFLHSFGYSTHEQHYSTSRKQPNILYLISSFSIVYILIPPLLSSLSFGCSILVQHCSTERKMERMDYLISFCSIVMLMEQTIMHFLSFGCSIHVLVCFIK